MDGGAVGTVARRRGAGQARPRGRGPPVPRLFQGDRDPSATPFAAPTMSDSMGT